MIDQVMVFLRDHLNTYFQTRSGQGPDTAAEEKVRFFESGDAATDSASFKPGVVTVLLINVEEERAVRDPDPFSETTPSGVRRAVRPAVMLNLYVLFVVNFKRYEDGLAALSAVIRHFQSHRVFDPGSAPELGNGIQKIVLEMVTLPMSEQHDIWAALRTTYLPSVMYRVRMVVYRDEESVPSSPVVQTEVTVGR